MSASIPVANRIFISAAAGQFQIHRTQRLGVAMVSVCVAAERRLTSKLFLLNSHEFPRFNQLEFGLSSSAAT